MKRDPVLVIMSIIAGLQAVVTSADWSELVSPTVARVAEVFVIGATMGMAFYLRGKVTPDAPTRKDDDG